MEQAEKIESFPKNNSHPTVPAKGVSICKQYLRDIDTITRMNFFKSSRSCSTYYHIECEEVRFSKIRRVSTRAYEASEEVKQTSTRKVWKSERPRNDFFYIVVIIRVERKFESEKMSNLRAISHVMSRTRLAG